MSGSLAPRSRRAVIAAALTGTGALLAAQAALPLAASADDPNDVVKDTDNATAAVTSITQGTADTDALKAAGKGTGVGLIGTTEATTTSGVVGLAGDASQSTFTTAATDLDAGSYGYADQTIASAGVWGELVDGIGVAGTGGLGGFFLGTDGILALNAGGAGIIAHVGSGDVQTPGADTALFGSVTSRGQIGIEAHGRVRFPDRSGHSTIKAGASGVTVTVPGVSSGQMVIAVLNTNRSGRWVRAAVAYTGKIAIYLNGSVTGATSVAWLVLG